MILGKGKAVRSLCHQKTGMVVMPGKELVLRVQWPFLSLSRVFFYYYSFLEEKAKNTERTFFFFFFYSGSV